MTAIDRTAYPRLKQQLGDKELPACYDLSDNERAFIRRNTRQHRGQLIVAVMLKTRQQLGYFVNLETVPMQIINYLAKDLNVYVKTLDTGDIQDKKTLYRYRAACRKYLGSKSLSQNTKSRLLITVNRAAYTMSDPADLINVALEELNNANIELPAFSTLDRWASHER